MFPFIKTLSSLKRAGLFVLIFACIAYAIIIVSVSVFGITWITASFVHIEREWLDKLFNFFVGLLLGVGGWFMLPALTVLISGMFQEKVIYRVEKVYYPDAILEEEPRFWPDMWHDIKFTIWALFLNVIILPLYFVGIGFIISVLLNSYLLGREFFESAAGYHLGKAKARELGKQNRTVVYGGGLFITLFTLIPFLNLFVPILAVVWMVHVYHRLKEG